MVVWVPHNRYLIGWVKWVHVYHFSGLKNQFFTKFFISFSVKLYMYKGKKRKKKFQKDVIFYQKYVFWPKISKLCLSAYNVLQSF